MSIESGLIAVVTAETAAIGVLFAMLRATYRKLDGRLTECERERKALNSRLTELLIAFTKYKIDLMDNNENH